MTRHASIQAMLARRDRLNPEEEAAVAAHITECRECRERATDYSAQVAFLRSFRREATPPGLRDGLLAIVDQSVTPTADKSHTGVLERLAGDLMRGPRGLLPSGVWRSLRRPAVALAAAIAIAIAVLSPLVSERTATPASADQLLRAAAQTAQALPSSGTATITYLGWMTSQIHDHTVPYRLAETWAATDAQHYRTVVQTIEPAIDSGTLTTIQDGSRVTQYDTRTETASVRTWPASFPNYFSLAGGAPMGGVAPGKSIQQYLDATQQNLPPSVPHFARILGKAQLLGRRVDVVQFAPVVRGIQCISKGQTSTNCNTPLDYGTATVWIDDATHFVLRYRADLPNPDSPVRSTLFQVTSFTLGRGATEAQLSTRPPVPVQPFTHGSIGSTSGGGGPPGFIVPAPHGFLSAPAPSELRNANSDMEFVNTLPLGDITGINILFNPNARPNVTYGYVPGDHFLLIEERIRVHGLPAALQVGAPVQAGTCRAWAGSTPDSLHTLAFARGTISILVTSDSLSTQDLVSYAAQNMCR